MPDIPIIVSEKQAAAVGEPMIVCGNSDYTVTFAFDGEWTRYPQKTARFRFRQNGILRCTDVIFSGDTVEVPVLSDTLEVEVGVFAGNLRTTQPARIPCAACITDGAASRAPRRDDVYDQLLEYLAFFQLGGCLPIRTLPLRRTVTAGSVIRTEEE